MESPYDMKAEDRMLAGLDPPKPFKSDGCSVIGPIVKFFGYENSKIRKCCYQHDRAYHKGGPLNLKRAADYRFWLCLITVAGLPTWVARLMFLGVTIGGFIPHPKFRWGFGWPFPKYKGG